MGPVSTGRISHQCINGQRACPPVLFDPSSGALLPLRFLEDSAATGFSAHQLVHCGDDLEFLKAASRAVSSRSMVCCSRSQTQNAGRARDARFRESWQDRDRQDHYRLHRGAPLHARRPTARRMRGFSKDSRALDCRLAPSRRLALQLITSLTFRTRS